MSFENKLVAIINKDLQPGVAMNALAHMAIGLGAQLNNQLLRLDTYQDKDGNQYPNISQMPFIILRSSSNEIRKTVAAVREHNIKHGIFVSTMTGGPSTLSASSGSQFDKGLPEVALAKTGGTYLEQLDNTLNTPADQLIFYGAVLFGPWELVSTLTKKLSLYK